ncbi:phosphatidate cytidylyltransferase [Gemmatimonas aurantiaca]|nr:phosphatidate cytidylyltransferase [Gemmatimonas aurantiaca]
MISKNLLQRIIVAIIAIPGIVYLCYLGGRYLQALIVIMTAVGALEYLKSTLALSLTTEQGKDRLGTLLFPLTLSWFAAVGIVVTHLEWGAAPAVYLFLCYFLLIGLVISLRGEAPRDLFMLLVSLSWGVFYVSMLYPFLFHIRNASPDLVIVEPFFWVLTLWTTLWIGDTAAMWVGQKFGQRKLAPTVSPNKTVEGFIGGLLGALLVGLVAGFWLFSETSPALVAFGALIISLVGQLGDLVESMWKRTVGIKDSSAFIPGHGGVLDRFDSLAFAAPALYGYLLIISRWQ